MPIKSGFLTEAKTYGKYNFVNCINVPYPELYQAKEQLSSAVSKKDDSAEEERKYCSVVPLLDENKIPVASAVHFIILERKLLKIFSNMRQCLPTNFL